MVAFTQQEMSMLKTILEDKYSSGSFMGMITNQVNESARAKQVTEITSQLIDEHVKVALVTRIRCLQIGGIVQ